MDSEQSFGSKPLGYGLTLIGGLCWAIGGSCGQVVFSNFDISSDWLVPIRLLISSAILLIISFWKCGFKEVFCIFHSRKDTKDLLLFSLFGAGASQYTYYTCIQYSNAAFATVISYMFPAIILLYGIVQSRRPPKLYELLAVLLVTVGALICTTHLEFGALSVSPVALMVGLLCALASAYNTVKPQRLLRTYPLMAMMGLSMGISGVVLSLICRPWRFSVPPDGNLVLLMAAIIVGGTVLAFCFFQAGVRIVGSLAGGILAAVEPAGAVLISVCFLGIALTSEDFVGFLLILATIPLIAWGQSREDKRALEITEVLLDEDAPVS